jgi:hypothetical protein
MSEKIEEKFGQMAKEEKRGRPRKEVSYIEPLKITEVTLESGEKFLIGQLQAKFNALIIDMLNSLEKFTGFKAVNFLLLDKLYKLAKTEKIGDTEGRIYALELLINLYKTNDENRRNRINEIIAEYVKGLKI